MKVAIIKSNYTPYGGAEKYTTRLIKAFLEGGHEVELITASSSKWDTARELSGDPALLKIKIIGLKQFRFNNFLRLVTFNKSVKEYLKTHSYDCILGMDNTEWQTHIRLGGGLHRAWLERRSKEENILRRLSFRLNPFHLAMLSIQKKALRYPGLKRIICNSRLVMEEVGHYYPDVVDKAVVVHNGVEWTELSEAFEEGLRRRDELLRTLNLTPDRFYFLFVGSGYERKGLEKAIRALKGLPEYTFLLVVGKDRNERRFHKLVERLSLGKRVYFFGPRRDIKTFYQVSDAFVLPTIYDPFSNATLEALAMGLFSITSKSNGASEVIKTGAGSIIEDLSQIESVRDAMAHALKKGHSKREIRDSVKDLEMEFQLKKIIDLCRKD